MIGGNSGVVGSLKPGEVVFGYPAVDIKLSHRISAAQRRLPEMLRRIRALERQAENSEDTKGD
jgi:UDP-3-O-[3-hydroxymyristoyl] glucosamine N-acyltransferase